MGMNVLIGKNVCIELKNGNKYFDVIKEVDESPKVFSWIVINDKFGKEQIFSSSEITRVEVLE